VVRVLRALAESYCGGLGCGAVVEFGGVVLAEETAAAAVVEIGAAEVPDMAIDTYRCVDCSCGRLEAGAKDPGGGAASTPSSRKSRARLDRERAQARSQEIY